MHFGRGIVDSNPAQCFVVYPHFFCAYVVLCRQGPCDGLIPHPTILIGSLFDSVYQKLILNVKRPKRLIRKI
jgi:hypothetical protein